MIFDFDTIYSVLIPVVEKYTHSYINALAKECYDILKKMSEKYDVATAGDSSQYDAHKAYYGNIKIFTYKLGCPEVDNYRFVDLHFCHFCKAEISRSKR